MHSCALQFRILTHMLDTKLHQYNTFHRDTTETGRKLMSTSEAEIFGPELDAARKQVDQRLDAYTQFENGCPERLSSAIRYSLLSPGKRLRPILVLAACKICDGDINDALPAACAVEMIHTYSLIHDDLPAMDDDDLRRGQPSCHVAFDEATAILAGDSLIPLAFQVMLQDLPAEVAVTCCRELSNAAGACQLVGGQSDDLALQNTDISVEQLEAIHQRKTGALFTTSLRMGCICAKGNSEQLQNLSDYGESLGLAFQITDDLLDLCGDEDKIGKRLGKDSEQGKRTYPELIGVEASENLASVLVKRAMDSLDSFGANAHDLRRFAKFVIDRNY